VKYFRSEYHADNRYSSGMCKAGFAGDDAPRAVFRKSTPAIYETVFVVTAILARIA